MSRSVSPSTDVEITCVAARRASDSNKALTVRCLFKFSHRLKLTLCALSA